MGVEEKLIEATQTAEIMDIVYYGGSQPGKARKIAPISVKNGKVRARCYSSDAVKMFNIDKIEILTDSDLEANAEWKPGQVESPHFETFQQILDENTDRLKDLGWHIEYDEEDITLHRRFKNGKLIKTPDVQIYYEECSFDLVMGLDEEIREENFRKKTRPYGVRAKNFDTKTFGKLDKAVTVFMEQAEKLSPVRKQEYHK